MPAVLVKSAYSTQNCAPTPLFCSNSARYPKKLNFDLIRWLLSQDLCNVIFRYVMAEVKALPSQEVINRGKRIR